MSEPILKIDRVSKSFGGFAALTEVSIAVAPGERFGLIGPNGAGKPTRINCVAGALRNDGGSTLTCLEDNGDGDYIEVSIKAGAGSTAYLAGFGAQFKDIV